MEQHKLPNVTIALVLSIISFIACCCSSGLGGLVFSGIALYLVNKDEKEYLSNPENYSNYSRLKTTKTLAHWTHFSHFNFNMGRILYSFYGG